MANREEYIDKLEQQLREWNKEIEKYEQKTREESKEIREKASKQLSKLEKQRDELEDKLDQIRSSGQETFKTLRKDAENLWGDLKQGVREINSILRK